jgi:NADH-quinone oxidoreductase subunit N
MTQSIVPSISNSDWFAVLPMGIVAATALVVLLADLLFGRNQSRYVAIVLALIGIAAAAVVAAGTYGHDYVAFFGGFIAGGFPTVMQEIVLLGTAGAVVLYATIGPASRVSGSIAIMLWSACGAMLMAGAISLIMIFLGLELLSLGLYALCAASDRKAGREAALKYLILSSTATAFLLFGSALLFGSTGSVFLAAIARLGPSAGPIFWMGAGMFLIGVVFKLSLVPFHTWTPDVFEGAPLPVTAFMSVVTKAGTLAVFARFIYASLPVGAAPRLLLPVWIVAAISMIAGNVGMLAQQNLKRLLGYSSIAQVGYILVALAGGTPLGVRYAIYYLTAYALMNLGVLAVAAAISDSGEEGAQLSSYRGLGRKRPWLAAAMTVFLLALAGLPPTAGFLGKILILSTAVANGYLWLAAFLIAGTAISLYAYAKIIAAMYGADDGAPSPGHRPLVPLAWASVALCAIVVVAMAFYPLTPSNVLPLAVK